MESKYELWPLTDYGEGRGEVFRTERRKKPGTAYLLQRFACEGLEKVDNFVKSALDVVKKEPEDGLRLIEFIPIEESQGHFTVSFLYLLSEEVTANPPIRPVPSSSTPPFLTSYHSTQNLPSLNSLYIHSTAYSSGSNSQVYIKEHSHYVLRKLRPLLTKALLHARLRHRHIIDIVDLALMQTEMGFTVALVFDRMETDLKRKIMEKKQGFEEGEIVNLMRNVSSAVGFIHSQVFYMQKIAHCNIKPSKILQNSHGDFILSGFGLAFCQHSDSPLAKCEDGTVAFMSPEMKTAFGTQGVYNPYKGDVFALGATVLCAAKLTEVPVDWEVVRQESELMEVIEGLRYSKEVKEVMQGMMRLNPEERWDIETVIHALQRYPS